MTHPWDEFSKSLADSVPRRESLRRLGFVFAGAALSPFGLPMAWARGQPDPCKNYCRCSNKTKQNQCLSACRACNSNTSRLCGSCGNYVCCGNDTSCCGNFCTDIANDVHNCGACGYVCPKPGPNEYGACIDGHCEYTCVQGAVRCNGTCTNLDWDSNNCGACGHVCPDSAPYCGLGQCQAAECEGPYVAWCPGVGCTNLLSDNGNCGACGVQCAADENCTFGVCLGTCSGC